MSGNFRRGKGNLLERKGGPTSFFIEGSDPTAANWQFQVVAAKDLLINFLIL